jgi:Flp pilus assembly protein TadB
MTKDHARDLLVDELKDAVGDEAVERSDLDVDRALDPQPRSLQAAIVSSRLLLVVVGGALLIVGVVASLATKNWIWFGVAIAAHVLISAVVVSTAFTMSTQVEKPGPTTATALEAEGVADPEGALNDLVEQVADQDDARRR